MRPPRLMTLAWWSFVPFKIVFWVCLWEFVQGVQAESKFGFPTRKGGFSNTLHTLHTFDISPSQTTHRVSSRS
jgi:hypothetical protein